MKKHKNSPFFYIFNKILYPHCPSIISYRYSCRTHQSLLHPYDNHTQTLIIRHIKINHKINILKYLLCIKTPTSLCYQPKPSKFTNKTHILPSIICPLILITSMLTLLFLLKLLTNSFLSHKYSFTSVFLIILLEFID